ncbi:hypothetical protein ACH5AL_19550 [Actinacidiphila glaucinigra]|uniref:SMODS-associated NUDIX domain-containing protein n=1 Tax=Actinacidiphila glaucinigra TaxID=235986 RepID=UPI0037BD2ECC
MARLIAYLLSSCALFIGGFLFPNSTLGDLFTGGFLTLAPLSLAAVIANRVQIRLFWYSLRYPSRNIRISAAYLFRIKLDGRYMLVKGSRFPHFQPVGGVFKVSPQGQAFLSSIGAQDDDLVPLDHKSNADIRIRIRGRQLSRFYGWYDSRAGREDSPWREFHEELVATGHLDTDTFPYVFHDYLGRIVDRIRFSAHADSLEILIADIYDLLPTAEQEQELRRTMSVGAYADLRWFDEQTIRRKGAVPGTVQEIAIADHAEKIL